MYTDIGIFDIKLAEIVQDFIGVLLIVIISIRMYEFTVTEVLSVSGSGL